LVAPDSRVLALGFGILICVLGAGNALFDISFQATGPWRMIGLASIFAVGIAGLWTLRNPAAALACFLAAVAVGIVLLIGRVDPLVFQSLFWTLMFGCGLWLFGWVILRLVLPRIAPVNAMAALMLGGVMIVAHLAIGFAMLQPAGAFLRLQSAAILTTEEALNIAARNPNNEQTRINGVLAQGFIGGRPDAGSQIRYRCNLGRRGFSRMLNRTRYTSPSRIEFVTAEGSVIETTAMPSVAGAINWPELPEQIGCGLRPEDPVVIWATPLNAGSGRVRLSNTRLLAYGDAQEFRAGFATRAEFGARLFGGVAFLAMLSGLYPMIACVMVWRRLRQQRA
jgi:hypothetical protein